MHISRMYVNNIQSDIVSMMLFQVGGLYLNCAMNSKGIQCSGGFGLEMANLIVDGTTQTDMFAVDIARFQNSFIKKEKWLDQGTHESQVRTYWVGYPTRQPYAARNHRISSLHEATQERGAFYGVSGGFEVPRFYLKEQGQRVKVPEYDW